MADADVVIAERGQRLWQVVAKHPARIVEDAAAKFVRLLGAEIGPLEQSHVEAETRADRVVGGLGLRRAFPLAVRDIMRPEKKGRSLSRAKLQQPDGIAHVIKHAAGDDEIVELRRLTHPVVDLGEEEFRLEVENLFGDKAFQEGQTVGFDSVDARPGALELASVRRLHRPDLEHMRARDSAMLLDRPSDAVVAPKTLAAAFSAWVGRQAVIPAWDEVDGVSPIIAGAYILFEGYEVEPDARWCLFAF